MYIPVSGGYSYPSDFSEGFVVRFYKADATDWVANMKRGRTEFDTILKLEHPNLLVIAGGRCYIMNPEDTNPVTTFGKDYQAALQLPDGRIILNTNSNITIVSTNGEQSDTKKFALYGIKDICYEDGIIKGIFCEPGYYDYEEDKWPEFTLNIENKELTGAYYYNSHNTNLNSKPWWKFWE